MKFRKVLATLTGANDLRVLKAFVYITRSNHFNPRRDFRLIVKDRLFLLLLSLSFPLIVRLRKNRERESEDILIEPSNSRPHVKAYTYFIKKNAGIDVSPYHWRMGIFVRKASDVLVVLRAWLRIVSISLSAIFIRHNIPMIEIWKFNILMTQMHLDRPRRVYVVDYSSIVSYLLVLSLEKLTSVFYLPTNSNLDVYMRYGYFGRITIILSSPLLSEQLNHLEARGWVKLNNTKVELWGSLFSIHHDQLPRTVKYDLGFFSSGEWARTDGLFNVYTRAEICENMKHSNEFWELGESIIFHLINFVRANDLTLKIYLHPYERYLVKEHEIYPPFVTCVDNRNVFMSDDFGVDVSNFFEVRIAVATTSSILFDRAAYGLETLFYVPKQNSTKLRKGYFYSRDHLKSIANNSYEDIEQLDRRLSSLFPASSK